MPVRWAGEPLDALQGTPFRCLAVSPASPALVAQARQKGFTVIDLGASGFQPYEKLSRASQESVVAAEGVWPGVRVLESGAALATPSSEPWIDTNTWMVRSLKAWSGTRPVLVSMPDAPKATEQDWLRAMADVAVAGGRWMVPLAAAGRSKTLADYARFFEQHAEWLDYPAFGTLGIIQDSDGKDVAISGENLNLIARRGIPYRVIERTDLGVHALAGLKAVLATDLAPATPAERKILDEFHAAGGIVIAGDRDPETLSKEMIDLIGDENVGFKVFNAPSVMAYATVSRDARRMVLHLINYATAPTEGITVRVRRAFPKAQFLVPGSAPRPLSVEKNGGTTEASIPSFPVYAAVVCEGDSDDR